MKTRQAALFALLAATLAAAWWVSREDEGEVGGEMPEVAQAVRRPAAARPSAPAAVVAETPAARFPGGGEDLFPAQSWRPPPPPPRKVEALPPPPPMAPPLPFKYVGRWVDESGETLFLAQGERVVSARAGQRLDAWRLDKIGPDSLTFTYLPLDQQRPLRLTP